MNNEDQLRPGETLKPGEFLVSSQGRYMLLYQPDGNLVLYQGAMEHPVWDSDTRGESPGRTEMQDDGNLVVYNVDNQAVWSSDTFRDSSVLILQDDGHLLINSPDTGVVWDCCPTRTE